jgi:hypothetical protein
VLEAGCATALVVIVGIGRLQRRGRQELADGGGAGPVNGIYRLVEGMRLNMSVSQGLKGNKRTSYTHEHRITI